MIASAAYIYGRSNECAAALRARRLDEYREGSVSRATEVSASE